MTTRLLIAALALSLHLGCACGPAPSGEDAGEPVVTPDAGRRQPFDAGILLPPVDAGVVFTGIHAGEACPPGLYGGVDLDGGEADAVWGLCVALRELTGTALLDDLPAVGSTQFVFQAAHYQSEIQDAPDIFGRYAVKVMRSRYDILKYHPSGVFPTHEGPEEFGLVDMTKDQSRDVKVRSHEIRGGVTFGGLPFAPSTFPPDVQLSAAGFPSEQRVSVTSQGGSYEARLLEGSFSLWLSAPPSALMGTELIHYPVSSSVNLTQSMGLDIDVPASELDGNVTLDGAPIPDRKAGTDFQLDFTPSGGSEPIASTHHEGGINGFTSLVPQGKYSVMLRFEAAPDKHLPSMIWNKQVAQLVDLNQNATLNVDLGTRWVEGGILIDGAPPPPNPGAIYTMFWYGWSGTTAPASFLYYELPLDTASFQLRTFPSEYTVFLWLEDKFGPDLVEGWYIATRSIDVQTDTQLPIDIETATLEGHLKVDGVPVPKGVAGGELRFRSRDGTYSKTIVPLADDGTYRIRIPKGHYDIYFRVDNDTYPEYATGWSLILGAVDLTVPQPLEIDYRTILVSGPLRVGGEIVKDNLPGADVSLVMQRYRDRQWFQWDFPGGTPEYRMRIPEGDYTLHFQIHQGAIPDVAWGEAPMGVTVPLYRALPTPPPPR